MSEYYKDKLNVIGCYNCVHNIGFPCDQGFDGTNIGQCHVHIADIGDDGYDPGLRWRE